MKILEALHILDGLGPRVNRQVTNAIVNDIMQTLKQKGNNVSKTLHNSTVSGARQNVSDLSVYGNGDTFKLICKASSNNEGWMKSTKAMQIDGIGCIVQVTTQQGDNIAEALTFVPGIKIELIDGDKSNGRRLVSIYEPQAAKYGDDTKPPIEK